MSSSAKRITARPFPIALAIASAVLLVASLLMPLWHMRLEAPQYRNEEALNIAVFPSRYGGDLREVRVLNQYIGVHVPSTLPQFEWLPYLLVIAAVAGIGASVVGQRYRWVALLLVCGGLSAGLLTAVVQAKYQMHDIGHKRDQHTILAGMRDFTPPFLGTSKIAQFTVTSGFGLGGWFVGAAIALQASAACACGKRSGRQAPSSSILASAPAPIVSKNFVYQI